MKYPLFLFVLGCSDYEIKSITPGNEGEDSGSLEVDTETTEPADSPEDCTEEVSAFDIEEVSTLQDSVRGDRVAWNRDAVALHYDPPTLLEGESWRVSSVDVLVMIPTSHFYTFQDGQEISVEVFDSNTPDFGNSWLLTLPVVRSELTWLDYTLPFDAAIAGQYSEFAQKGAWLRFEFADIIPAEGMQSTDFIAGVRWFPPANVAVGYSNFNRDCGKNWTEYGENTGWILNSTSYGQNSCSWPMLRVMIENRYIDDCE